MASMAHQSSPSRPSLTQKRRYVATDGKSYVEIRPNMIGLATVHDRDVLIYCISQVMAALNDGNRSTEPFGSRRTTYLSRQTAQLQEPVTAV